MAFKIPREIKIGIVTIVSLGMIVWGVSYLKGKNFFMKQNNYYIVYQEVEGLTESGEVVLNGLKVGNINHITYSIKPKGILVEISIEDKYKLPKFTRAEIFSSDLMGTKAIRLDLGIWEEMHQPWDTLLPAAEPSLQDKVGREMLPVKLKAEELMMEMQKVLETIKYIFNESTRENLSKSFESIKITLSNLESSSISLDTLLSNGSGKIQRILSNIESISTNLRDNNEELATIIQNFEQISDTLAKAEIASTISSAESALKQANIVIERINKGEGTLGLLLNNDTLYNKLEDAASNLDKLMIDLKENPKRYIHFSLIDWGKTYTVSPDEFKDIKGKDKTPKKNKVDSIPSVKDQGSLIKGRTFRIQIKSAIEPIRPESKEFKGYTGIEEHNIDNRYKYTLGKFATMTEAIQMQNEIRNDFPDAFVVCYK